MSLATDVSSVDSRKECWFVFRNLHFFFKFLYINVAPATLQQSSGKNVHLPDSCVIGGSGSSD